MKKINIKSHTIIWSVIMVISLIFMIICSVIIARVETIENLKHISIESLTLDEYSAWKAYSIGILAFSVVLFVISSIVTYLGIRSWHYRATL